MVGGTAFFFARDENVQAFDWLFVDEAGQVGLANMVAMGRAARNIVLVGDPRQLPQVIQGAHPAPANLSCLEWMLGNHATIPPDRGIFLGITRRMHPEVNRFISDQVYEGRLESHPATARHAVTGTNFPKAGAYWVPVAHEGNAQVASEEVEAIRAAVEALLTGAWTEKDGVTRPIRQSDIIVVAPYNAPSRALSGNSEFTTGLGLHLRQNKNIQRRCRRGPGKVVRHSMSPLHDSRFHRARGRSNDNEDLPRQDRAADIQFPARRRIYRVWFEKVPCSCR